MKTAILIVDHGSNRPGADATVRELVGIVKRMAPAGMLVEYAHMEFAEPTIAQGFARLVAAGAEEIVGQPLMLAPGQHATVDVPRLAAEASQSHPGVRHTVTAPLGADQKIAEIVLERCREAMDSE